MGIFDQLHPEWQKRLADYKPLVTRIDSLIDKNDVTPPYENIFAAYQLPPEDIEEEIFKLLNPLTVGTLPGTNSNGVLALI